MRALAAAVCLLTAAPAAAGEARYVVRGPQLPVEVAVNGYVQSVTPASPDEVIVQVATSLAPVGAKGSYGLMARLPAGLPEGFALPARLDRQLEPAMGAWEAATAVLDWVALHLRIDDGQGPQDAGSVLARRSGRCSGVANAAVALLRAAGFDARTISGVLVTDHGVMPHRWLECRLPGAGWVPSDPTLGLWSITPQHMVFADTVSELPGVEIVRAGVGALERLPRWRGRPIRPNEGAVLVCRLVGDGAPERALAILFGRGGEVRRTTLAPEGRFEALLPGRWRLLVVADGVVLEQHELELKAPAVHSLTVERSRAFGRPEVGS